MHSQQRPSSGEALPRPTMGSSPHDVSGVVEAVYRSDYGRIIANNVARRVRGVTVARVLEEIEKF